MNKSTIIVAMLGAGFLSACGSKTDANEKNFSHALNQYFDQKGDLCLHTSRWPMDLSEMDLKLEKTFPGGNAGEMHALEAVGLVKGVPTDLPATGFDGKPIGGSYKVVRYTLTEAAKPYEKESEVPSFGLGGNTKEKQVDLCYGRMALDKIVKWEGPIKLGDYQEAEVTHTYKIDKLADWAKKPEFQAVFGGVKSTLEGAGSKELKHGVKLTSVGWEALGLN